MGAEEDEGSGGVELKGVSMTDRQLLARLTRTDPNYGRNRELMESFAAFTGKHGMTVSELGAVLLYTMVALAEQVDVNKAFIDTATEMLLMSLPVRESVDSTESN